MSQPTVKLRTMMAEWFIGYADLPEIDWPASAVELDDFIDQRLDMALTQDVGRQIAVATWRVALLELSPRPTSTKGNSDGQG